MLLTNEKLHLLNKTSNERKCNFIWISASSFEHTTGCIYDGYLKYLAPKILMRVIRVRCNKTFTAIAFMIYEIFLIDVECEYFYYQLDFVNKISND